MSLHETVELARSRHIEGLDLRAAPDAILNTGLTREARLDLRRELEASGVRALTVSSYLKVCDPGDDDVFLSALNEHIRLAEDVGASFVRIFPGKNGAGPEGDKRAVSRLLSAVPMMTDSTVRVLMETHDSHPKGADIAAIIGELGRRCSDHGVGVIWDALHPWRAGEPPETTLRFIEPWFEYIQIKDATASGELCLVGEGIAPLDDIAKLLRDRTELWWSLEWERLWEPSLAVLPVALDSALSWYAGRVESEGVE